MFSCGMFWCLAIVRISIVTQNDCVLRGELQYHGYQLKQLNLCPMKTGGMDYKVLKGKELSMGGQYWATRGVDNPANRTLIAEGAVHQ